MEWNELRAFIAVADTGSFSRAAEQLHLTQPAITKRIQALEAGLAVKLFDRVGKRVYLTEAGGLLQPRARALLDELADTEVALRNLHLRVDGRLAMATSHHVGLHRLAPVLKAFSQRYPDAELDIEFVDSEAAHDLVRSGATELAVVTLAPVADPLLASERLWRDPLAFVAATDHPLSKQQRIPLAQLAEYPAILPGLGTYTGRIVAERFARASLPLHTAMATNYLETIGMLVGIGLGWSVLPATMIRPPMTALDVDCELLGRDLGAVTNPARTLSNPARAFLDILREFAD
jgi:DNA-binding transcriptional LysR family regulator